MIAVVILGLMILGVESSNTLESNSSSDSAESIDSILRVKRAMGLNMKFAQEVLDEHNKYRKLHGVPPLKLTETMMLRAHFSVGEVSNLRPSGTFYGENVYKGEGPLSAKQVVESWYNGIQYYKNFFGGEPKEVSKDEKKKIGQFAQIIWKKTTELGVGVTQKNGQWFVVTAYNPRGLSYGSYKENVLRPKA
ncbi:Golgi-associated plant pathogenesis-related protein 1 [Eurytemora carolleeae]|uniref:Golgi-associated plant pathogenesis-related protein 1 n=1 Tax=Eurytemora carolleeae TaxID=1294199 RepID=UPI000C76BB67|nr:Golgi-associated plant pathogenesis-related protein 1 [Eurytemora carolleeae]|eukprot:XP_023323601.1 Golgi-associated plant pathogenesis-related protein 1-like [Eurytemora affinis]